MKEYETEVVTNFRQLYNLQSMSYYETSDEYIRIIVGPSFSGCTCTSCVERRMYDYHDHKAGDSTNVWLPEHSVLITQGCAYPVFFPHDRFSPGESVQRAIKRLEDGVRRERLKMEARTRLHAKFRSWVAPYMKYRSWRWSPYEFSPWLRQDRQHSGRELWEKVRLAYKRLQTCSSLSSPSLAYAYRNLSDVGYAFIRTLGGASFAKALKKKELKFYSWMREVSDNNDNKLPRRVTSVLHGYGRETYENAHVRLVDDMVECFLTVEDLVRAKRTKLTPGRWLKRAYPELNNEQIKELVAAMLSSSVVPLVVVRNDWEEFRTTPAYIGADACGDHWEAGYKINVDYSCMRGGSACRFYGYPSPQNRYGLITFMGAVQAEQLGYKAWDRVKKDDIHHCAGRTIVTFSGDGRPYEYVRVYPATEDAGQIFAEYELCKALANYGVTHSSSALAGFKGRVIVTDSYSFRLPYMDGEVAITDFGRDSNRIPCAFISCYYEDDDNDDDDDDDDDEDHPIAVPKETCGTWRLSNEQRDYYSWMFKDDEVVIPEGEPTSTTWPFTSPAQLQPEQI